MCVSVKLQREHGLQPLLPPRILSQHEWSPESALLSNLRAKRSCGLTHPMKICCAVVSVLGQMSLSVTGWLWFESRSSSLRRQWRQVLCLSTFLLPFFSWCCAGGFFQNQMGRQLWNKVEHVALGKCSNTPEEEKFLPVTMGKKEERSARYLKLSFGAVSQGTSKLGILR